jgi:hypothetical protein
MQGCAGSTQQRLFKLCLVAAQRLERAAVSVYETNPGLERDARDAR